MKTHRTRASPGLLLAAASQKSETTRPVGTLAARLHEHGWDGQDLTPEQAGQWLKTWGAEVAQRRAARLSPSQRGPGAERSPRAAHYRAGREIYKKTHAILGARDHDGTWHDRPNQIDNALWDSRSAIWHSAPPLPDTAKRLLDLYFQRRPGIEVADRPRPSWARRAALVLTPSGGAPGVDGAPYEEYHPGA
eukprot:5377474-Pyramimonas_sp.AAC.1